MSRNAMNSSGVEKAGCAAGDTQSPQRHAPRLRDLGRDLGGGQDAAVAGLGALGELHLDHLHLGVGRLRLEPVGVEGAVGRAAAEVARPDLPDQVAPAFAVVAADRPLARVVREAAHLRAPVQREDRVRRQRPEAHGRDVVERGGIGLPAGRVADQDAGVVAVEVPGLDRMGEPGVAGVVDALLRAEGALVLHPLRALVDDRPLLARERLLVAVAFDEVLADLGADAFEDEAHVAEDRVVPEDRVPRLPHIVDPDEGEAREDGGRKEEPHRQRHERQAHRPSAAPRRGARGTAVPSGSVPCVPPSSRAI
jgi:hypothetical protein